MKDDPRDVLGDDLWELLGQARAVQPPAAVDRAVADRIAEAEGREALGDDVWDLLGRASPVEAPLVGVRPPPPLPWRGIGLALLAAAIPFAVVPLLRHAGRPPPASDDLALVRELDLAANLDLVASPDFDVLLRWDGRAP